MKRDPIERFKEKYLIVGECWEWQAAALPTGYGKFYLHGNVFYAHQASLILFKGEFPREGFEVLHSCDNTKCVNPDHLRYGTHAENMIEAQERNRIKPYLPSVVGELNPNAKISNKQKEEIIERVKNGEARSKVAKEYCITTVRVSQIMREAGIYARKTATELAREARLSRTHCPKGHPYSGSNLIMAKSGARLCRICKNAYQKSLSRKKRAASVVKIETYVA